VHNLFTGTAGVPPATFEWRLFEGPWDSERAGRPQRLNGDFLKVLGTLSGRPARGPSEELEWL
jgi:hypothetical protein